MSRPANPPREELLAVDAFVRARMAEAAEVARTRRYTNRQLPVSVDQVVVAADRLVQARLLWAEMLSEVDPKDNHVRALAAPCTSWPSSGTSTPITNASGHSGS